MYDCIVSHQKTAWERRLGLGQYSASGDDLPLVLGQGVPRIRIVGWMWDETLQRMRSYWSHRQKHQSGGRTTGMSKCKQAFQVMVQKGNHLEYDVDVRADIGRLVREDPVFVRAFVIEKANAEHILEGILRSLPWKANQEIAWIEI